MSKSVIRTKRSGALPVPRALQVRVGILAGADDLHPDAGELTVEGLAEQHEFGLGVPQRSFIRAWCDARGLALQAAAIGLIRQCRTLADFRRVGKLIAVSAEAGVQEYLLTGQVRPQITNPLTIARKKGRGFDPPYAPLVETGFLAAHITSDSEVQK